MKKLTSEELANVSGGNTNPRYYIDANECINCGTCLGICPAGAIQVTNGETVITEEYCVRCGNCKNVCPVMAIRRAE